MKTLFLTFSILFLIIFSCKHSKQNSNKDNLTSENENGGNIIDYDKTKVLKSTYVIDRKGAEIKQKANESSRSIGIYEYGEKLDVIEETENWFGIRDRISRDTLLKNDDFIESTSWKKIYVAKSKTGSIDKITLIPSDLNIITSLAINRKEIYQDEDGKELKDFLKIELIDKQIYNSKIDSSVNFLLTDTTHINNKKGILTLKCKNQTKQYIDKHFDSDAMEMYTYVGHFDFLNKYLVNCGYWESSDYRIVDKVSGIETETFMDFPYISPNKKNIICISTNGDEATTYIEMYSIKNAQIKHIMTASFRNWLPKMEEPNKIFWCTDNYLYLSINHIKSFWKENGSFNDKYQYIRIKILPQLLNRHL